MKQRSPSLVHIIDYQCIYLMKRQGVDFSDMLHAINLKVDSLTKQVTSLTLELKIVKEENRILKAENTVLGQRLAKYEPTKDSHNSSIPPSKENMKAQAIGLTQSLCKKSNRPSSGQPGHKGSTSPSSQQAMHLWLLHQD